MKIVKKQLLRVVAFAMVLCLVACCFAGCGKEEALKKPYKSHGENIIESKVLASNDNFELAWDADAKAVLYKHKNGMYWSDILYEQYKDGSIGANGSSPISITVFNNKTLEWSTITSGSVMETYLDDGSKAGYIYCGEIQDGIRVYYFFEQFRIAVPVDYVLKDDHIEISINSSEILEDAVDYKLVSVSVMNNFASVKNAETSNLFVPTGTGAIINCAETSDGNKEYSGIVYGDDLATRKTISYFDNETIRMPVFGSYDNEKGLLAIIEESAGSSVINLNAANDRTGYSTIYSDFYVRGYDRFMKEYYGQNVFSTTKRPSDNISGQTYRISYYPLFGEDADYNGMAKKYKSYLEEKGELVKSDSKYSPYSVTLLGGTNTTKSFFGIPYNKVAPLTTFKQAEEIIKKLNSDNAILPQIRLLGYGDKGVRPGTIAGGSSYPSEYGDDEDLESLINYCKDTNLFLDFDIVTYSESGNGFSLGGDVAKTAVGYDTENFPTSPTRLPDEGNVFYALGREHLIEAGNTALEKASDYSAKAVSFSTLGLYAYSDYNEDAYVNRYLIEEDTKTIINNSKKNGYKTAVAGANAYAAAAADIVFDAPINSGEYIVFDYDIPFYQMVFGSYKPLYSEPVNSEANIKKSIAKTLAYGMGLGYYITDGYVSNSDDLEEYKLYQTVFDDNAEDIKNALDVSNEAGFASVYNKIAGASLDSYTVNNKGLAISKFSNGVTLYTNISDYAVKSPVGVLEPYEFKLS